MKRRQLIKSLLAASVASLGGVAAFQCYQQSQIDISDFTDGEFLRAEDQLLLSIFIPVFAAGMPVLPDTKTTIANIEQAILRVSQKNRKELRQLFDLLGAAYGRLLLAGVWLNWQKASVGSIATFLSSWREHRLALLQQAYLGIHQLIMGAIYAEESAWAAIEYPGPPQLALYETT